LSIRTRALSEGGFAWRIVIGVAGLIATAIVAYWPAWSALWRPHGFLVAFLALWLLVDSRARLKSAPVTPLVSTLVFLVPCAVATLVFWHNGIPALQLLTLPLLIFLATLAAFGVTVARTVAVPIAFLYFAAPAWKILLDPPLQALTVHVVALLAPIMGLPATVQGTLISFPDGPTFEVTLECSGVGFLVQGLAIATLLGELEQARLGRRLRLLGSMVVVTLVTNWIRVLLIIEVGYRTNMRSTLATRDHVAFGYLLLVAVLAVFVWVATRRPLPAGARSTAHVIPAAWHPRVAYFSVIVVLVCTAILTTLLTPPEQKPTAARRAPPRILPASAGELLWASTAPSAGAA
jgi:exosortase